MSYSRVRNKNGISEKRAHFGAHAFSDVTQSIEADDLGGGSFFCAFSDVPENGNALSLNLHPHGRALETRADFLTAKIKKALRRVEIRDLLYGEGDMLTPVGNASVEKNGEGYRVICNFFAKEGEPYEAPGAYITKKLAPGEYLFRIYLGGSVCPKIKIYESTDKINFEGKPDIAAIGGVRYAQAKFTAEKTVRIDLTYENTGANTATYEIVRAALINTGAAKALGAEEREVESRLFEGETEILESIAYVPEGENEAEAFGGGRYCFKRGTGLYTFEPASGRCFIEYPLMPESGACAIYRRGDGFIAVCESGMSVTTSDLAPGAGVKIGEIYTPVCYCIYDPAGDTEYKEIENFNIFSEYFYVKLLMGEAPKGFLPDELRLDVGFCEAYDPETMRLLPEGEVTLDAREYGGGAITDNSSVSGVLVKLRIRKDSAQGEKIKKCRALLFSPDGSETFPSESGGGHCAVLYRGKEMLALTLSEDMYAPEGSNGIKENTENISSVLKYSENFLVFSPHYIRKAVINEGAGGFDISLQNFGYDTGCDMPASAVCADDKIIFANSHAGVFCIDRFGFTQRDMSRHVSANIEEGDNGLFTCSEADLSGAEAAICDGKYFLRVGEYFYIWDFAHAVPTGTEKASEERKLRWFMYSGVPCRKMLGADGENIYFLTSEGDLGTLARGTLISSDAESYFRSRSYRFSQFSVASVMSLSLSLAAKSECTVRLYFDGEEGNAKYTFSPRPEKSAVFTVRPEERKCRSFAFSLHSFGGVRLEGIKIEYLPK